jgi:putative transposase
MESGPRRRRVEPTDQWEQIELLCGWPEQRDYELIRPLVLFGDPADGRSRETGASSGRTLRRRAARFEAEGMESLFDSEAARRRRLPPGVRRLVVDLKAEYPAFNPNEISRICYVRFGRRPACKTVKRVLTEEPVPLRFVRRFPPYHEIPRRREARAAVALHADGWSAKAISGYLRVGTSTVYRILRRWAEEGPEGLEDRRHGRPPGVRKVTLKAIEAIRRLQQNPHLGEFRIHAALAQIGLHLSPRTCGRVLALNRELYGLEKPKGPAKEKREMPFAARRRHQFWSANVPYVANDRVGGRAYVISVLDNHSRAILASAVSRTQDLASYLSVLYAAVERYGSPEALRELPWAKLPPTASVRSGILGRGRMAQGPEAAGLRRQGAQTAAGPPAGLVRIRGSALAPLSPSVGVRGTVLERDEAAVEDAGFDQFQVDVREAGEDRLPSRFAEDLREHH